MVDKTSGDTRDTTEEEKEMWNKNSRAIAYLTKVTKKDHMAARIVRNSSKNMNAYNAWKALRSKYDKHDDCMDGFNVWTQFMDSQFDSPSIDPDQMINYLIHLKTAFEDIDKDLAPTTSCYPLR